MKKRITMFVLTLALVFTMMPFGLTEAYAIDGATLHNQIAALPSEEDANLKNYAAFIDVRAGFQELFQLAKDGDTSAKAGITEDDVMKLDALNGKLFALKDKLLNGKIKGLKVKAGKKKATLTWKKGPDTGATYKYVIYQSTDKEDGYKKVATTKSTKKVIKKLKKGKKYYFKVVGIASFKGAGGKTEKIEMEDSKPVRSKKIK